METNSEDSLAVALENLEAIHQSLSMLVNCYHNQPDALQDRERAEGLVQTLSSVSNDLSTTLYVFKKALYLRGYEDRYLQAKQENRERLIAESASKPVDPSGRKQ